MQFYPSLALWETEISNLYSRGKNASRGTHPDSWVDVPFVASVSMTRSLFQSTQIILSLHTPGSRTPQGKGVENSEFWEQLGSLFTILAACITALPVCLKHSGKHPVFAKAWTWPYRAKVGNKIFPKLRIGAFVRLFNFLATRPCLYHKIPVSWYPVYVHSGRR
jgi:hypothetical protein